MILNTIKNYVGIGMVVTIAILSYLNRSLRNDNEDLIAEVGVERLARITAQERLDYTTNDAKRYYENYVLLQESNSKLALESELDKKKLEDYKRRNHIAIKKPKLVERLANNATVRLFNDYSCTTGNSGACTDNKD